MKLLKFCLIILILLISEHSMAQFSAGEDATACGTVDTLSATTITGGYWTIDDSGATSTNCPVFLVNSTTGELDNTDPSAVVIVGCNGDFVFTWHEVDGESEETDDVSITFSEPAFFLNSIPSGRTCLNDVSTHIDTTGLSNDNWFWMVYPEWEYIDDFPVSFDPTNPVAIIHKEFDNAAFGDSSKVEIPLIVTVVNSDCSVSWLSSVTFYQRPEPFLGSDTMVCGNEIEFEVTATIAEENAQMQWYGVGNGGMYTAIPEDDYNSDITASLGDSINIVFSEENLLGYNHPSCLVKDSIIVEFLQTPFPSFPETEMHVCGNCAELSVNTDPSVNSIGRWLLNSQAFFGFECGDNNIDAVTDSNAWMYHSTGPEAGVDTVYVVWQEFNARNAQCFSRDSIPVVFWFDAEAQILLNGNTALVDSTCGLEYNNISANAVMPNNEYSRGTWRTEGSPVEWYKDGMPGAYNEPNLDFIKVNSIGEQASLFKEIYWIIENGDIYPDQPAVCTDTSEFVTIRFDNEVDANILTGLNYPEVTINCGDTICLDAENNTAWTSFQWVPNDYFYYKGDYDGSRADTLFNPCLVAPSNIYPHTDTIEGNNDYESIFLRVTNGVCMDVDTVNVKFAPIPTGTFVIQEANCAGEAAVLMPNTNGGIGLDMYLTNFEWVFEEGNEPSSMNPINTNQDTVAVFWSNSIQTEIYKYPVNLLTTNYWGCQSQAMIADTIRFPEPAKVEWAEVNQPNPNSCDGMVSFRNYADNQTYAFEWDNNPEFSNFDAGAFDANDTIYKTDLCSGVYYLRISYESEIQGNCMDTLQYVLFGAFNDTCNGLYSEVGISYVSAQSETDGAIDVTAFGGATPYSYMWSGPNGFESDSEDLNNIGTGLYIVSISDELNCIDLRHIYMYEGFDASVFDDPIVTLTTSSLDTCLSFMPETAMIYDYVLMNEEIIVKWMFTGEDGQMQFLTVSYQNNNSEAGAYVFELNIDCDLIEETSSFSDEIYIDFNFDISVSELENRSLNVYPNPSNGRFFVETESVSSMTLTDLNGRIIGTVQSNLYSSTSLIDLSNQKSGVYLLHLKTKEGQQVVKLIKE